MLGALAMAGVMVAVFGLVIAVLLAQDVLRGQSAADVTPISFLGLLLGIILMAVYGGRRLHERFQWRMPMHIPARQPPPVGGLSVYYAVFREGFLETMTLPPKIMRRLARMRGGRLGWGTRTVKLVAERLMSNQGWAFVAATGLLIVALLAFQTDPLWSALVAAAGAIVGILVIMVWYMGQYREVERMFPSEEPSTANHERMGTVSGAGDPFVLKSEIEQRMMALRNQGLPNYVDYDGWTAPQLTLAETGRVTGQLGIETHPEYSPTNIHPSALRLANAALLPLTVSVLSLALLVPLFAVGAQLVGLILFLAFLGFAAFTTNNARRLAERYRWESTAIYVDLEGSIGKSEIRAGRGRHDSFESTNTVLRSDCQVRVWSASFLTESASIEGWRDVIATGLQGQSQNALQMALSAVNAFADAGVKIRGIDLHDKALNTTTKANMAVEAERQRARLSATRGQDQLPSADLADAALRLTGGEQEMEALPDPLPAPRAQPSLPPGGEGRFAARPVQDAGGANWGRAPMGTYEGSEIYTEPRAAITRSTRSMRMRCPKCGRVNEFHAGEGITCTACGFAKYE